MKHQKLWMAISGAIGLSFFLIANLTTVFVGLPPLAGTFQLGVNAFVFIVWRKAFISKTGFDKFWVIGRVVIPIGKITTTCGVVVPVVMASITLWRVLLPFVLHWLSQ